MSASAVVETSTYDDALETASSDKGGNGVVFVAYDPETKGRTLEEKLQSTLLNQVFGQVARKLQAAGNFALLDPSTSSDEIAKFGDGSKVCVMFVYKDWLIITNIIIAFFHSCSCV